jgi:type II secretory pathway predicted ATPase ExeA
MGCAPEISARTAEYTEAMYCDFYQMRERPFNVTADPKFLYLNARYREALASLHYGITQRKGFITLIGEAGTGKTTLLKKLLDDLDQSTRTVFVFNTNVTFDEILEYIFGEFDLPVHNGKRLYMLQRLNTFLLDELGKGRNVALLIDEAQDLDYSVLEDLRLLSNLETAKEKILQIVMSGQPELGQKLGNPGLRQLRQRIAVSCRLLPLTREELTEYIQARLTAAAAADPKLFTRDAEERIFEISTGIPRLVNIVCDNSLVIGYALGKKRIGADVVNEAAADLMTMGTRDLGAEPEPVEAAAPIVVASQPRSRRRSQIGVIAVVVVALVIGLLEVGRSLLLHDQGVPEHAAAPHPMREVVAPGLADETDPRPARPLGVDAAGGGAAAPGEAGASAGGAGPALAAVAPAVANDPPAVDGAAQAGSAPADHAPPTDASASAERSGAAAAPVPAPPAAPAQVAAVPPVPSVDAHRDASAPAANRAAASAGENAASSAPAAAPIVIASSQGYPGASGAVAKLPDAPVAKLPEAAPDDVDDLRLVLPDYRRIMVKPGDSVSQIATNTYGQASATMLDLMKMANPSIRDIDTIAVGQELRLPQLDQGLAVLQEPDGQFALLVLSTPAENRARDIGKVLRKHGFEARVGRADFGGGRTVWRVVIGDLPDRAAAQTVGKQLQRVVREDTHIEAMADRLESNER